MHLTLDSVVNLLLGVIFIVFSEVIGGRINKFLNTLNPMERNEGRTRFICIIIGTWFVIYAAWSTFGT